MKLNRSTPIAVASLMVGIVSAYTLSYKTFHACAAIGIRARNGAMGGSALRHAHAMLPSAPDPAGAPVSLGATCTPPGLSFAAPLTGLMLGLFVFALLTLTRRAQTYPGPLAGADWGNDSLLHSANPPQVGAQTADS